MASATTSLPLGAQQRRGRTFVALAAVAWSSAGILQRELTVGVGMQVGGRALFAVLGLLGYVAVVERSRVMTDQHPSYPGALSPEFVDRHETVNHIIGEYVRGEVHTNNLESFWSLLKRGIMGTYHNVSKKYLPLYLAEFQFRYNNRNNPDIFGKAIGRC